MRSIDILRKVSLVCLFIFSFTLAVVAQKVGSKVSLVAVDGKTYTGTITEVHGQNYKIKYDGFDFESVLSATQFTLITPAPAPAPRTGVKPVTKPAATAKAIPNGSKPVQQNLAAWMDRLIAKPASAGSDGAVTYEILSFEVGSPRKWQYSDGGNPSDGHNTTVYPVKVHFIQKTHYRTRTRVLDRQTVFTSFKDAFGEWKFGYGSTPHIDKSYDEAADM